MPPLVSLVTSMVQIRKGLKHPQKELCERDELRSEMRINFSQIRLHQFLCFLQQVGQEVGNGLDHY